MSNYLTTNTELTSIANAIRTKGGTQAQLTYPAGFVSAIEAIPTGGGSLPDFYTEYTMYPSGHQYQGRIQTATIHINANIADASSSDSLAATQIPAFLRNNTIDGSIQSINITGSGANTLLFIPYRWCYKCVNLTTVNLPNSIKEIGVNAFDNCQTLSTINWPTSLIKIWDTAFNYSYGLTGTLDLTGTQLSYIGSSAFLGSHISTLLLPSTISSIQNQAFAGCSLLTEVRFNGTPSKLYTSAFQYCTAITDIYVPWSEGAVAGAPWGATNATVHYDTTN